MQRQLAAAIGWTSAVALAAALAQGGCDGRPLGRGDRAGTGGAFGAAGASGSGGSVVIGVGGSGVGGSGVGGAGVGGRGAGGSGVGGKGTGGAGVGGRGVGGMGVGGTGVGGAGVGGAGVGGAGTGGSGAGGALSGCDSNCVAGEMCAAGICRGPNSRWTTIGGDVHHSGYNVNETGGPPTALAWQAPLAQDPLWPVVSDGTAVYASAQTRNANTTLLSALSTTDGHSLWSHDFGLIVGAGQPSIDGSHVYIAQCDGPSQTYMFNFSTSGAFLWLVGFDAQLERFWAPLVAPSGRMYFDGGTFGGLYGIDTYNNGSRLFFSSSLEQEDQWSPLLLDGMVYTFLRGKLRVHDPKDGTILSTVTVATTGFGASTPVSDGDKIYAISPPNLYAFSPGAPAPDWTAYDGFTGVPAVANGVVYAIIGGALLHARDAGSGAFLWTFPGDGDLFYPPVVAGNYVYVASANVVYAVNLSTHVAPWKATPGGWLSIAGGKLYVAQPNGTLSAYTLGH